MNAQLIDFMSSVQSADSIGSIQNTVSTFLENFGFTLYTFASVPKRFDWEVTIDHLTNMDAEWIAHYQRNNYVKYDWTSQKCLTQLNVFDFDRECLPETVLNSPLQKKVMDEAPKELVRGFVMPCRTKHTFSGFGIYGQFSKREYAQIKEEHQGAVCLAMSFAYFGLEEFGFNSITRRLSLSARQREVLMYKIDGLTREEIADKLHITESTVDDHWNKLGYKLGVESTRDIIPRAFAWNLID